MRSVPEPIDDFPTGKFVEGILSTIAQFENDDKAVRTKKGMKEALERQKMLKEQSSASSQTKERRGFTVKPEKKRG